jgi:hypothetical protein
LELWSILRRRSLNAMLIEPPNIVVSFDDLKICIACKKLYSENHVQNVLSQAMGQIEAGLDFGIVSLNLDDLLLPEHILCAPTQHSMSEQISTFNAQFLITHERHFRKYLASSRLISALVSTCVLADVHLVRPRFNNARQSNIWAIPGLPPERDHALVKFYNQLML